MGGMISKAGGSQGPMGGIPTIDTGKVDAMGDKVSTHIGSPEMAAACGVAVANAVAKIPEPLAKIGVSLLGANVCKDLGPDGKVGSQPPSDPLKGPDGTT